MSGLGFGDSRGGPGNTVGSGPRDPMSGSDPGIDKETLDALLQSEENNRTGDFEVLKRLRLIQPAEGQSWYWDPKTNKDVSPDIIGRYGAYKEKRDKSKAEHESYIAMKKDRPGRDSTLLFDKSASTLIGI